ncbi:peptidoglycan DD-metalloendopeptidase family protein [Krasilnikovia sp. M28-CT-15]|uniref:peptidoglycan DD-metalloendopeptidase family protein n=1 Tax=Krasilnikovia sp. M28-CT-15 TaxID=3373540 RepID=UPI0038765BAD
MERRRQRRTARAGIMAAGLFTGVLVPASAAWAGPAASPKVADVGRVSTRGSSLNVRTAPGTEAARTGSLRPGTPVSIVCQSTGEYIDGAVRATRLWDRLPDNSHVSDAYVARDDAAIPACGAKPATAAAGGWVLPVEAGLVSGFRTESRPRHDGVDLGAARETPIRAAAAGTVNRVRCNVSSGSCDADGNRSLAGCGWYAEIHHAGDIVTRYCHMVRRPSVKVGQAVTAGQIIGYVGTSGSSSGPHLHFEVHTGAPPATHANAIEPIAFLRSHGLELP